MDTIKTNVWKSAAALLSVLVAFVILLAIVQIKNIFGIGVDRPIMNSITVSGKGDAVSIPDVATFSFSITETAKTVADAQKTATTKQNSVIKALKDNGIAEKDIKTQGYSINPHYEYQDGVCTQMYPGNCRPGKSVLTGYDVSQTTEVKVRDLSKAGAIFDVIGGLEVQNVNGLSFSIDDIDTVKAEARSEAIANAKSKAEKLARDLDVRLVRIVSFSDNADYPYPMYGMGGDVMNAKVASVPEAVAPEISTGEQKITSNVSITYEIR
jgi:uncharacterized protein YggE